ncbi:MAG TPA: DEAD/DEAH box helicase [Polyangia bacterium]|nr:DEAD/DEAH box helicase [Polyangia bacterium]
MSQSASADLELAFYEQHLIERGLEPYPVQEQAFSRIFAGESLLCTVPTGTGKTLMAKAGIFAALGRGQRAVYTTPLRALTEEKYRELAGDFGAERVGFATGDYKVNPDAPVQVMVAEILWNQIFGARMSAPADVVIMDEGHYFNDPERGYVWEQSIIGLDPRAQLVVLSATIGNPEEFCQWVYLTRRVPMALVRSDERRVPLYNEYRETYLIDLVRDLADAGDWPALIFTFGRELCFERARLIKSCRRFTSDEERDRIAAACEGVLGDRGAAGELRPLLLHGIGIHHAGILPRYKQLVEQLTLERLIRFVVSTETISAGINLPAKRVVFPELKKVIRSQPRLLTPAEYHQMAGRAGRPQFDREGIALTLAPEEVVQEIRKQTKETTRGGRPPSEIESERIRKSAYARARGQAQQAGQVTWDAEAHARLVAGRPAPLRSQTNITAEQILAIGLPDLATEKLGEPTGRDQPAYLDLNIHTVIDHLLLPEREQRAAQRRLAELTDNLRALGVLDEHGRQVAGHMIGQIRGVDGPFVWYCLQKHDLTYPLACELCEYLLDEQTIWRLLSRKQDEKRREWVKNRLRERRREEPQVSWEDVEEEYERTFPRELAPIEKIHAEFAALLAHPELHGGKVHKRVWPELEQEDLSFMDFVEKHGLAHEEGSLFSYLARLARLAKMLFEVTTLGEFEALKDAIRRRLSVIDDRVLDVY